MAEAKRAALWSPEALDDRERIWDYYVRVAGRHTAEKILREIAEVIALIEDHPFAGRARNEVRGGLRSFAAKPHVIFYRVVDARRKSCACWMGGRISRRSLRHRTGSSSVWSDARCGTGTPVRTGNPRTAHPTLA
jgi:plasmid stabilization system protein ParE